MNLLTIVDRIVDRILPQDPATKRQARFDRLNRLHADLHAAWDALPDSPDELSHMVDRIYRRPFSADDRVCGIVRVVAESIQDPRDYYSVDVPSSKLLLDDLRPYIQVTLINIGLLNDFYPSEALMSYISSPVVKLSLKR